MTPVPPLIHQPPGSVAVENKAPCSGQQLLTAHPSSPGPPALAPTVLSNFFLNPQHREARLLLV